MDRSLEKLETGFEESTRTLDCIWTIVNFLQHETETFVESELFCAPAPFDVFSWKLRIYPIGKSFISPHLILVKSPRKVQVDFQFETLDTPYGKINKKSVVNSKQFWEGKEWAVYCISFDPRLLPYSTRSPGLTLKCTVVFKDFHEAMSSEQEDDARETLFSHFQRMYEDMKYTDITFQIDGKKLRAHKTILAARSPVLSAMFNSDMQENKDHVVSIPDVEFDVMEAILRFTYTAKVTLTDIDFAIKVYEAADKYDLDELRFAAENYVHFNISASSVVRALIAGHLHFSIKLKSACTKYIAARSPSDLADWFELENFTTLKQELFEDINRINADNLVDQMKKVAI